ncbi:MAG: CRISPR-associated protein Cas5 [Dethiobacteria bacterium]
MTINEAVAVFDLTGSMAHFRKYYTNSSSLTYGFPPRSVLMGVVAAVLGMERDSYYETLDRGRFSVAVKVPGRRLMQTVNYTRTKKEDLGVLRKFGAVPGTQIPLELLLPDEGHPRLCFRVFFSHPDQELLAETAQLLQKGRSHYPLYLGLTECPAMARFHGLFKPPDYRRLPEGTLVGLTSVLNTALLQKLVLNESSAGRIRIFRERAPHSFGEGRRLQPPASLLYTEGEQLTARLRVAAYHFEIDSTGPDTVAFMES